MRREKEEQVLVNDLIHHPLSDGSSACGGEGKCEAGKINCATCVLLLLDKEFYETIKRDIPELAEKYGPTMIPEWR